MSALQTESLSFCIVVSAMTEGGLSVDVPNNHPVPAIAVKVSPYIRLSNEARSCISFYYGAHNRSKRINLVFIETM